MRSLLILLLLSASLAATPCWALNDYGVVNLVTGQVTVLGQNGKPLKPAKGHVIHEGDTLMTGADGELHVTTMDQGLIALRANTRLKVEAYRAKGDKKDKSVLMLQQGRFRSVTGWIGRDNPPNYKVRTVTAVIGVRGTDHEPAYVSEGSQGLGEPGTYDKVNEGETYIKNSRGSVKVKPKQSGFAPARVVVPVILSVVPAFYKPTQFENLIQQRANELEELLLQRPRQIQQEIEQMKERPRQEMEQRMRKEIPGGFSGW